MQHKRFSTSPDLEELDARRARFCTMMDTMCPQWDTTVIVGKVNQYYFTGTMQDATLIIRRGGVYTYYVRTSYERARLESPLEHILPMQTYADAAAREGRELGITYVEGEIIPYNIMERLQKYFTIAAFRSGDPIIRQTRAVKTPYELYWLREAGARQDALMMEAIPALLEEGISEAEFVGRLLHRMIQYGYHGISRFHKFQTEIVGGQFAFGDNSLYPTCFDGPAGHVGTAPAAPVAGSPERFLKRGDLVFVDIGFGVNGYHSDKTQLYLFGGKPSQQMIHCHQICMDIEREVADQLRPGAIPSQIYQRTMERYSTFVHENFMGFGARCVRFLGHGIGLQVDELPVIANGFDAPLEENMTFALEPKKGIAGAGMVGVEDAYIVTADGGECISGGGREIVVV